MQYRAYAIGEDISTYTISQGKPGSLTIPEHLICVKHEYGGKVVIVQPGSDVAST
jgi:hypothetical protein